MPRAKASVSDRIVADVLSLPHQEAVLLVGYLATTLRLSGVLISHTAKTPKAKVPPAPAAPVVEAPVALPGLATRRPRIKREPAPPAEVPAAAAVMEVGEEQ